MCLLIPGKFAHQEIDSVLYFINLIRNVGNAILSHEVISIFHQLYLWYWQRSHRQRHRNLILVTKREETHEKDISIHERQPGWIF